MHRTASGSEAVVSSPNSPIQRVQNLPRQLTSFVGRDREVAELIAQVDDPRCRLLTLAGPGGIGKTRLAIQVAEVVQDRFADGVTFVPLQPVETPELLLYALADALGLALSEQDPEAQLFETLEDAQRLLVLDNFEQLLEAADWLSDLLYAAPELKLLVTSREILNLQEEWIYPVQPLQIPIEATAATDGDPPEAALLNYDATRLFVERARRVNPRVDAAGQAADIVRVCQLVDGIPLAIELAASWVRTLACAAIAEEIQRDLQFLTSSLRNIPERHRSMRVVFDRSWRFLTPAEQATFSRLAVFRGGFSRHAAAAIAQATLPVLTTLVDKSLLRVDAQGRYHLHELLRQYAEEQLATDAGAAEVVADSHCRYYCDFLAEQRAGLEGSRQRLAIQAIGAELENVRAAWQRAVERVQAADLYRACEPLCLFLDYQGRYRELWEVTSRAHTAVTDAPASVERNLALAALATNLGWVNVRLGRLPDAEAAFVEASALYGALGTTPIPGVGTEPRMGLAIVAQIRGEYASAAELAHAVRRQMEETGDVHTLMVAYYGLASAYSAQGELEEARRSAEQAFVLTQATGHQWMQAYVLRILGDIARGMGEYDQARRHYQACFDINEAVANPEGMALALVQMAQTSQSQGRHAEAEALFRRSEGMYRPLHDRGGLIKALQGLGESALERDDPSAAAAYLHEALRLAADAELVPAALSLLVSAARLLGQREQAEFGQELLTLAACHPAGDHETRQGAERRLAKPAGRAVRPPVPPGDLDAVYEDAVQRLLAFLAHPVMAGPTSGPADNPANAALVEPLTEREMEVLQLLALGRTNLEIADELIIAVGTVKSYTSYIYRKLDVSSRTQAIARARELGLI